MLFSTSTRRSSRARPGAAVVLAAGLASGSLLAATKAHAESPPCEPFGVLGASVVAGEQQVERDARLMIGYRACGTIGSVTLLRGGVAVESDVTYGATVLPDVWASVKPRAPLESNVTYTLAVATEIGSASVTFTTGQGLLGSAVSAAKASVIVTRSRYVSPVGEAGFAVAQFDLELAPPADVTSPNRRGGVVFLGLLRASPDLFPGARGWDFGAQALAFTREERPPRVAVSRAVRPGEPACFEAVFEDGAGRLSAPSDEICATVPGEPPPPEPEATQEGCTTSPRRGEGGWLLLAAVALAMARRRLRRT